MNSLGDSISIMELTFVTPVSLRALRITLPKGSFLSGLVSWMVTWRGTCGLVKSIASLQPMKLLQLFRSYDQANGPGVADKRKEREVHGG